MAPLRMTLTAQLVLRALLADPGREMYGREVMQSASLASGTVYPILARLEAEGWLSGRDEVIDKRAEGRPARRYYKLTEAGIENAAKAMARASSQLSRLGLDPPPQVPPLSIGGFSIPVLVDDRQPPGIVSVVSAGLDGDGKPVASAAHMDIGADEGELASEGPCEHRIPPGSYCARCGRLI
jgi:PadR family transcriptional regulator, regulatory protein PadR